MRFIPGYAGNAEFVGVCRTSLAVYPRLRGERPLRQLFQAMLYGLSPATRGTPIWRTTQNVAGRFIPGYAGNAGWMA